MVTFLRRPFRWARQAIGLQWLPPRARRPVALVLLYLATAALLWHGLALRPAWEADVGDGYLNNAVLSGDGRTVVAAFAADPRIRQGFTVAAWRRRATAMAAEV